MRTAGDSASDFKRQITRIVKTFRREHPRDYVLCVHAVRTKAEALYDPRFAVAPGSGNEMRALFELPELLMSQIIQQLSTDGLTWWSTNAATRWFCKSFPEFSYPEYV